MKTVYVTKKRVAEYIRDLKALGNTNEQAIEHVEVHLKTVRHCLSPSDRIFKTLYIKVLKNLREQAINQ